MTSHPNHIPPKGSLMTSEKWLPIGGYEGLYEVSDTGRVRSLDRTIVRCDGITMRLRGQVLACYKSRHYLKVELCKRGVQRTGLIHQLVCAAFHGPRPEGNVVRHLNGDYLDNRAENLAWGTYAENTQDMIAHGNAYWSNQTHCIRGHEFTPENTRTGGGRRTCRACERIRSVAKNRQRDELRRSSQPSKSCRVCSAQFKSHPRSVYCSPDCKRVSRTVAFKAGVPA
ncbi:NUMOD4 motif-containing HNH endonuclease [Gordonia sp. AC31]|uniref:NUMOD4 motif-containing HNH endonuclease n=1 Tax=Gordonia sp. AC31 TaxID=2962571 RepID=UPI0037BFE02A